jgi:FAD/FMN-containing dehydrogenase
MERFTNWAGNVTSEAIARAAPTREAEVAEAVRSARQSGRRIKTVGAGHSWSAIAAPDAIWMSVDALSQVGEVRQNTVTVGAGVKLWDLVHELAARGYSPSILGSIADQRVAGAIATGTHGSSLTHGNIASAVRGLRLVDGRGEVVEIGPGDSRLPGARVHLGALGVLTEVTLAVEPLFYLREERIPLPVDDSAARIEEIAASAEYVKWWWLPHTDTAMVFAYHRDPGPGREPRLARWLDEHVINRYVFPALLTVSRVAPALTPIQNRIVGASYFVAGESVDRMDRQLTLARPPVHREAEWAVPMANAREALERVIAVTRGVLKVNFILEVRFVKGDDGWMSPAAGGDRCAIGAYITDGRDRDAYFRQVAEALADLDPRPHWGKEARFTPADVDRTWPEAPRFRALARELDPDGLFHNAYLRDVIGL